MLKFLAAFIPLFALSTGLAAAQQYSTQEAVVNECALVSADEYSTKPTNLYMGRCINATVEYLGTLQAAGLPVEQFGLALSNLVVDLTMLLREQCRLDSEVARAIALVSAESEDPDQKAQILQISVTVSQCEFERTAALRFPFESDGSIQQASGFPASFS